MDISDKIKKDINENRIMLYMKGTKEMPMCGFSSTVVNILNFYNVDYETTNVLEDVNILSDPFLTLDLTLELKLKALFPNLIAHNGILILIILS